RPPSFTLADVWTPLPALTVVLARLQDPGNAGTLLRVAEAFGATGCVGLRETAGFHNGKLVRASAGSVFRLPHVGGVSLREFADAAKVQGVRLIGTAPAAAAA